MTCTYSFNPSTVHIGPAGTTGNGLTVNFDLQPGCAYFPITQQSDLQPWWKATIVLGLVGDLAQTFQVTCMPNPDPMPRMDSILIDCEGIPQIFTIIQDGNLHIVLPQLDRYPAFITSWLLRFWWKNPSPFGLGELGAGPEGEVSRARALQMIATKVENKEARQLIQRAVTDILKSEMQKLKGSSRNK